MLWSGIAHLLYVAIDSLLTWAARARESSATGSENDAEFRRLTEAYEVCSESPVAVCNCISEQAAVARESTVCLNCKYVAGVSGVPVTQSLVTCAATSLCSVFGLRRGAEGSGE